MTRLRLADGTSLGLAGRARRALESGATTVTIDLGGVSYLDPTALHELAAAVDSARAAGARLRFDGARPLVYKALHIAHLV